MADRLVNGEGVRTRAEEAQRPWNSATSPPFFKIGLHGPAVAHHTLAMSSLAATDHPEAPLFSDGLGERVVAADGATGELLQILRLRPALTAVPSFEFALRERAARLGELPSPHFPRRSP